MWANDALGHISCSVRHLLFSLAICTTWSLSCEGPHCHVCLVVHLRGSLEQRVAENTGNYGRNILPGFFQVSQMRSPSSANCAKHGITWNNIYAYVAMEDCLEEERYGKPSFNTILPCANFRKTVCCENLIGLLSKINRHLKLLSFLLSGFHVGILFFNSCARFVRC